MIARKIIRLTGISFNDSVEDSYCEHDVEKEIHPPKRLHIRGRSASRYETEFLEVEQIGSGEFGSVFKCINRLDGCIYAIKKSRKPLKGTSDERTALNEVYAHAVLGHHKHVVRYYSAWAENDHMLIQNEYCNGGSLAQAIEEKSKQRIRFSESDVKQILLHIALGLRYIHSLNLAHMDIKPGNIFITRKVKLNNGSPNSDDGFVEDEFGDEGVTYKIGDLGHVTSLANPEVEEGDCRYIPTELLQDNYSWLPKADIFALGLTIYEVCGGGPLPKNGEEWHAIREGKLCYLSYYSKDLNELIKQMIHPDPEMRPSSAALVQNETLVPYACKTKEQLNKELNAEKFKNQLLSRELERASESLKKKSKDGRVCRLVGGKVNRSNSVTIF
ncbi:wee1-like protein kinase isoform X2 [Stegodyphus dumicola]|uniref:wee1-like protein kinase isoform X2 n=1 Tax=Stegodyphus dumicola TaxID=202533 RepID=UPI0015AFF6A7|nr:wee1-like protein kinase isoform X2 [Stegodyphus dumicola]